MRLAGFTLWTLVTFSLGTVMGALVCQRTLEPMHTTNTTTVVRYIAPTPIPFPYVQALCAKQDRDTERMLLDVVHTRAKG